MKSNKYTNEWFKERAVKSITPIGLGSWDFSDSLLLYTPKGVENYEHLQTVETAYNSLVTKPETEYISKIADRIAEELPSKFHYIDLGPGTEHKERLFFDAFQRAGKDFIYFPVDVSPRILEGASTHAARQGVKSQPILSSFEECEELLPDDGVYRFVSLGLTFVNFHSHIILQLLREIAGQQGACFINPQIRERLDMQAIRNLYVEQTAHIIAEKVKLLGMDVSKDVRSFDVNDRVEVWCTLQNPTQELISIGVKSGDRLLVEQSLRYGLEHLKSKIAEVFSNYTTFDVGSSFVSFLLKKP